MYRADLRYRHPLILGGRVRAARVILSHPDSGGSHDTSHRSHPHLSADEYIAWHQHRAPGGLRISRRGFLKGSAITAIGVLAAKIDRAMGAPLARLLLDPKRIYLAPDDHTDYLWSANEGQYQQWFLQMLDYYLNQADATAGNPSQYQSRWNCDGSFWVWTYERNQHARTVHPLDRSHP